jgi:hypothetical protein
MIVVAAGAWQFIVQQRQANRTPFLQKQLDLCFEVTEAMAQLATETHEEKWEDARKTFWRLYWGPLSIVEDAAIESLMVQIGEIVPRLPCKTPELPRPDFERSSYRLAHAARSLMRRSWNIKLPALASERQR